MAIKYLIDISLEGNSLQNAVFGTEGTSNGIAGGIKYDTSNNRLQFHNGTEWAYIIPTGSEIIDAIDENETGVIHYDNLDLAGGIKNAENITIASADLFGVVDVTDDVYKKITLSTLETKIVSDVSSSNNEVEKVVKRDSSGNFSANQITLDLASGENTGGIKYTNNFIQDNLLSFNNSGELVDSGINAVDVASGIRYVFNEKLTNTGFVESESGVSGYDTVTFTTNFSFSPETDFLLLFENSIYYLSDNEYTVIADGTTITITLTEAKPSNTIFHAIILKNIPIEDENFNGFDAIYLLDNSINNDKLATDIKIGSLSELKTALEGETSPASINDISNIQEAIAYVFSTSLALNTEVSNGEFKNLISSIMPNSGSTSSDEFKLTIDNTNVNSESFIEFVTKTNNEPSGEFVPIFFKQKDSSGVVQHYANILDENGNTEISGDLRIKNGSYIQTIKADTLSGNITTTLVAGTMVPDNRNITVNSNNGITGGSSSSQDLSSNVSWNLGLTGQAKAFHDLASNGIVVKSGTDLAKVVELVEGNGVTIVDGNGISGNPTISIDSNYVGQASITTVGTISNGTWAGTTIAVNHGGTGATSLTDNKILVGNGTSAIQTPGPSLTASKLSFAGIGEVESNSANLTLSTSTSGNIVLSPFGETTTSKPLKITNTTSSTSATTGAVVISGGLGVKNATISEDLVVEGNLTVNGSVTIVNSNEVNIGDEIILLNSDLESSTANQDAGIEVKRFTSTDAEANVQLIYDESEKRWYQSFEQSANETVKTGIVVTKYIDTIGDGSATSFNLIHNLNTQDASVTIRETASPYAQVFTDVEFVDESTITIKFNVAPSLNKYTVTIIG